MTETKSTSTHERRGCSCDDCVVRRAKRAEYQRRWAATKVGSPDTPHGTVGGYTTYACRCDECRAAALERSRRYRQDEAVRKRQRASNAEYRRANREELNRKERERHAADRAKSRERSAAWRRANNNATRLAKSIRRARIKGTDHRRFTNEAWVRLCGHWRNCCAYCGESGVKLTIDHVVPLSRGGRHAEGNILPACMQCNQQKHALLLVEWRRRQRLEVL